MSWKHACLAQATKGKKSLDCPENACKEKKVDLWSLLGGKGLSRLKDVDAGLSAGCVWTW